MRIAALYDIHGNLPALEAVLEEINRLDVDLILVGGDVVPGPMSGEALDSLLLVDIPVQFIAGNGERETLAQMAGIETGVIPISYREAMRWEARQLQPKHEKLLASWPQTFRTRVDELGEVLFCHATPRNDNEIFTQLTPEERLVSIFETPGASLIICGHTHMQFDRMVGKVRVVNAGSVGMPFGEPGAYWLLLDEDVHLQKTNYDYERAAERIRQTLYPQAEEFASKNILHPPSQQQMLELFSKAELK